MHYPKPEDKTYPGHVPPRPIPPPAAQVSGVVNTDWHSMGKLPTPFTGPDTTPQTKPSNPKDSMGVKKAPMSTVSHLVLAEVGVAMQEGGLKYGKFNYRAVGVLGSVYFDAAMRHLRSWWEGEDIDQASQLSHITKAITSLIVLRDAMIMGKFTDDRPPAHADVSKFFADLDDMAAKLVERDGHIKPKHYTNANKNESV